MKRVYSLFIVALLLVVNSCAVSKKEYEEMLSEQSRQQEELEKARQYQDRLESVIDSLKTNAGNYQTQIDEYKVANSELEGKLEEVQATSAEYAAELDMLKSSPGKVVYKKLFITKIDTVETTSHEINSGEVAFHCPKEMYLDETYDAVGLMADVLSDEDVRKMVVKNLKQHMSDSAAANVNDEDFLIKAIQYYDMIELKLENVKGEGFDIAKVHQNDKRQISDTEAKWQWKVTPTASLPDQQLLLNVLTYDENGDLNDQFSKTYHFNVTSRPNGFFHSAKALFVNNPALAIGTILLPFLTFFAGGILVRKRNGDVA